jgi:hypothetical protein
MTDKGIRTSGNVNYHIWKCQKCSHESTDLVGLADGVMVNDGFDSGKQ